MFGYVRPLRCELKVREDEQFRAVYCGLCHTLSQEYGFAARFVLNYDFTFLALFFTRQTQACSKRCVASPLKKKRAVCPDEGLSHAAAASVVYTWWKLQDEVRDHGFWRGVPYRFFRLSLKGAYRRARKRLPGFDREVEDSVAALLELEREKSGSLDATADTFARCLAGLSGLEEEPGRARIARELFYHLGRWIYLMDAADDWREDLEEGNYNPLAGRFGLTGPELPPEVREALGATLNHSLRLAHSAWALYPQDSPYVPVLENTLSLGLPTVQRQVLAGTFHKKKKREIDEENT